MTERQFQSFESKYIPEPNTGCWLWIASKFDNGYGQFGFDGKNRKAHRVSYELYKSKIPTGLTLDHLCRVRECVNPDHLEPVTNRENTLRGNTITRDNLNKTNCPNGHQLIAPNLGQWELAHGKRSCLECKKLKMRARRMAKRRIVK